MATQGPNDGRHGAPGPVIVYSRPWCPFSASLMRGLDRAELPYTLRDIWEDEEAAAFVRSVTGGHETVPTVEIGAIALVNPTTRQVLATVAEQVPQLLPDGYEPRRPSRVVRTILRVFGG